MSLTTPHKQSINHKRARGQHHKQDHRYLKAYHPYLPLLLLVIVGLAINVFWTSQSKILGATTSVSSTGLLQATNSERVRSHTASLTLNSALDAAAQTKANDMASRNYWAHNTPDGQAPWSFIKNSGYAYQLAGENLAYGFSDAPSVITGWMNSPEHRANLLNDDYEDVGFGVATADNFQGKGHVTIVVAMYGTPQSSAPLVGTVGGAAGSYRTVSRVQMFTGGRAPWSFNILVALTVLAATIFLFRHALAWHKLLVRGEVFVLHHKTFDLVVLSLILLGVIMTRTSGFVG